MKWLASAEHASDRPATLAFCNTTVCPPRTQPRLTPIFLASSSKGSGQSTFAEWRREGGARSGDCGLPHQAVALAHTPSHSSGRGRNASLPFAFWFEAPRGSSGGSNRELGKKPDRQGRDLSLEGNAKDPLRLRFAFLMDARPPYAPQPGPPARADGSTALTRRLSGGAVSSRRTVSILP